MSPFPNCMTVYRFLLFQTFFVLKCFQDPGIFHTHLLSSNFRYHPELPTDLTVYVRNRDHNIAILKTAITKSRWKKSQRRQNSDHQNSDDSFKWTYCTLRLVQSLSVCMYACMYIWT